MFLSKPLLVTFVTSLMFTGAWASIPCGFELSQTSKIFRDLQSKLKTRREKLARLSDEEIDLLMDDWIQRKVKEMGYLPGLQGGASEPISLRELKEAPPDVMRSIYTNAATIFPLLAQVARRPNLQWQLTTKRPNLYDGLLVQEFAWRYMLVHRNLDLMVAPYLTFENEIVVIMGY